MRFLLILLVFCCAISCQETSKKLTADDIVARAIETAGGDVIANAKIDFKFRDYYYSATREAGNFSLERCTDPDCIETHDILNNSGFKRFTKEEETTLPDSLIVKYSGSVNSVHYFSVLPFGLDAPAVHKKWVSNDTVLGNPYYQILITFDQEGGGEDFQDQYMYWINQKTFTIDYLAYNYQVNEGGTRFREAYNPRVIEGVRVVDYRNFKPQEKFPDLQSLDSLFAINQLQLLSTIELENVQVSPCPSC